jgi:hypothetical protein
VLDEVPTIDGVPSTTPSAAKVECVFELADLLRGASNDSVLVPANPISCFVTAVQFVHKDYAGVSNFSLFQWKVFDLNNTFISHLISHFTDFFLVCGGGNKRVLSSDTESPAKRSRRNLRCQICKRTFNNPRNLRDHSSLSHNFHCLQCDLCFVNQAMLAKHTVRMHLNVCPFCKIFSQNTHTCKPIDRFAKKIVKFQSQFLMCKIVDRGILRQQGPVNSQALFKLCETCGAVLLVCESSALCCRKKKELVARFPPLWQNIDWSQNTALFNFFNSIAFRSRARAYQNMFRLCYRFAKFSKVHYAGEFLHLEGVVHCNASTTSSKNPGDLLFYIVENERLSVAKNLKLDFSIIRLLNSFLSEKNQHVRSLFQQYELLNERKMDVVSATISQEHVDPLVLLVPYQAQSESDVPHAIIVKRNESSSTNIASTTREYEALSYPFLFLEGCGAWGVADNMGIDRVTLSEYLKLRLARDNVFKSKQIMISDQQIMIPTNKL